MRKRPTAGMKTAEYQQQMLRAVWRRPSLRRQEEAYGAVRSDTVRMTEREREKSSLFLMRMQTMGVRDTQK